MKLLNPFNKFFKKNPKIERPKELKPQKSKKSAKDLSTERGEPWVNILSIELDPENIGNGSFELDWNDLFVAKLVRAGYKGKDDAQIVDQWFQTICRNVVLETYEQYEANNTGGIERKSLGNGRTEIS